MKTNAAVPKILDHRKNIFTTITECRDTLPLMKCKLMNKNLTMTSRNKLGQNSQQKTQFLEYFMITIIVYDINLSRTTSYARLLADISETFPSFQQLLMHSKLM
jgi:hypothetical protein